MGRVDALAMPFLSDAGGAEDDYALLPPPRPLGVVQLMGITFFAVSGSAYGIEETVSAGGPLLALSALTLAALCWSAPLAMVSAELSTAMPHSGGYIVWVNSAFGPMVSLLNGLANLLCNVFDCAMYPLLLTEYVERALMPLMPAEPHGGGGGSWIRHAPDVIGTAMRLLLVGLAGAVNVLSTNVVGVGAGVLMCLVTLPFVALIIAAYASPASDPLAPFEPSVQTLPSTHDQWYFFVVLVLWNSCGCASSNPEAERTSGVGNRELVAAAPAPRHASRTAKTLATASPSPSHAHATPQVRLRRYGRSGGHRWPANVPAGASWRALPHDGVLLAAARRVRLRHAAKLVAALGRGPVRAARHQIWGRSARRGSRRLNSRGRHAEHALCSFLRSPTLSSTPHPSRCSWSRRSSRWSA